MKYPKKNLENIVNPDGVDIATFATALLDDEEIFEDELDDEDYTLEDVFNAVIESIELGVEERRLTVDQARELAANALDDYRDRIAEELGIEEEEEYEEGDYSSGVDIATFQSATAFGSGLQTLLAQDGYEDLEEGIADLADVLGLNAEDIAGLWTGEVLPSEELLEQIADVFELGDEDFGELYALAETDYKAAGVGEDNEEGEEAQYSSDLEQRLAEFEFKSELTDALAVLEKDARTGVEEGWLPPVVYRELIGNFELEQDKIAAFSSCCEGSGVDANTQLYAINYAIEAFRRCGPVINFSSFADEPLTEHEINANKATEDQAVRNHKLRQQRSH